MAHIISYIVLGIILAAAVVKDIRSRVIPDWLIILGAAAGIAIIFLNPGASFLSSILGALAAGAILWLILFLTKGGIGMGDVKLFACVGLFMGLEGTLEAMLVSTVLSGIAGLIMLIFRISDRKGTIPFAPFIFLGTVLVILLG